MPIFLFSERLVEDVKLRLPEPDASDAIRATLEIDSKVTVVTT